MARIVKNTEKQIIGCDIITRFSDGSSSTKTIKVDDVVENLRYIKNNAIQTVTGRVSQITISCNKVTKVNIKNVVDYFSNDVKITNLVIDTSEQYKASTITVPAMEIVEDEGVLNVVKMDVIAHPYMTMDMEYTDGTIVNQDLEINDVLTDAVIMSGTPGTPDITGDFKLKAFYYTNTASSGGIKGAYIYGAYLVPIGGNGVGILTKFDNYISFTESNHADVTNTNSLIEIVDALNAAEDGKVVASLGVDVTIPKRDDGKITSLFINKDQELTFDLNGHDLNCEAYAFYVNGGTLNITGEGHIKCHHPNDAYPAIFIASNGVCNMTGGIVDTREVEGQNWIYGAVCSGDGVFNISGGSIITGGAACLSITNGTASGEGAKFNISGDAIITGGETGIYLADNKSIDISGNAVINNGILLRMGNLTVRENAKVNSQPADATVTPLGKLVTFSGCDSHNAAILALTGIYGSSLGNDLNITVKDNAVINGKIDHGIDIATINTKYDQNVTVDFESESNIDSVDAKWNIYNHDQLAEMVTEQGKTLAPETTITNLTVKVGGATVYPVGE